MPCTVVCALVIKLFQEKKKTALVGVTRTLDGEAGAAILAAGRGWCGESRGGRRGAAVGVLCSVAVGSRGIGAGGDRLGVGARGSRCR